MALARWRYWPYLNLTVGERRQRRIFAAGWSGAHSRKVASDFVIRTGD
jgi:hypothetical protein